MPRENESRTHFLFMYVHSQYQNIIYPIYSKGLDKISESWFCDTISG